MTFLGFKRPGGEDGMGGWGLREDGGGENGAPNKGKAGSSLSL